MTNNLSNLYDIKNRLGKGSFGEVYLAYDKNLKKKVACKIEECTEDSKLVRLKHEFKMYKLLEKNGVKCVPKVYNFFQVSDNFYILSMELMDSTLDSVFNDSGKQLDVPTVLKIGIQCIRALQRVHESGIIHRDIKPGNFVFDKKKQNIYVIDFGLSRKYLDSKKNHISLTTGRSLIGTARYASINIHLGLEPSRRDDLESLSYMLLYFLRGSLPWQGLKKGKNGNDKIGEKKMCTTHQTLCDGFPECFTKMVVYCRNLNFAEIPNYDYLVELLESTDAVPRFSWE